MALPKIVYNAGAGQVEFTFLRGPRDFRCYFGSQVHDNVATSGVRERVVERHDIFIAFGMPSMAVDDDLQDWAEFVKFALGGGQFAFYPNSALEDFYWCVLEDDGWEPVRTGLGRYAAGVKLRIVPGAQVPADPSVVLRRFYGL
jgi:hypothetical protein